MCVYVNVITYIYLDQKSLTCYLFLHFHIFKPAKLIEQTEANIPTQLMLHNPHNREQWFVLFADNIRFRSKCHRRMLTRYTSQMLQPLFCDCMYPFCMQTTIEWQNKKSNPFYHSGLICDESETISYRLHVDDWKDLFSMCTHFNVLVLCRWERWERQVRKPIHVDILYTRVFARVPKSPTNSNNNPGIVYGVQ